MNLCASFPAPPTEEKTRGVNVPLSTFIILSPYARRLAFSCIVYRLRRDFPTYEGQLAWKMRTSKNVLTRGAQKLVALISSRADSDILAVDADRVSPDSDKMIGSMLTSKQMLSNLSARRFRMLSCLLDTKPPLLQAIPWSAEKATPHTHFSGK